MGIPPFSRIRKKLYLIRSYLSLIDSQLITSCSFSALKPLTVPSKISISLFVHNKFPSSPTNFFFGGIVTLLYSIFKNNKESFYYKVLICLIFFLYYKLISNISIFYFHLSCKILLIWD